MRKSFAILLLAAVPAAGARAQDATEVPQISPAAATDASPQQVEQQPAALPAQLSGSDESAPKQSQLTSPESSDEQPLQVSNAPRNAEPPQPLSNPLQGRTAAVTRVHGKDRCDPADPKTRKSAECSHVIETRAAEFKRPSPTELSPEQKLMIAQKMLETTGDLSTATQRLAKSGQPTDALGMGVASIVLDQEQPKKPDKPDDPQTDAAVQAIIGALTTQPPQ
jgi:hypothetical protein